MYVMMNYLTNVWNLSTAHAAGIINIWNGITSVLAIVFAFFVDAFTGDFFMLVVSSIAYSVGLGLLSMSTPAVFGPCKDDKKECIGHTQKVLFYIALLLIAVGMAGHMVSLTPFLDLQTKGDEENKEENVTENENGKEKKSRGETKEGYKIFMQIPGLIMVMIVIIAGGIGLPYVKPWKLRFGIPAICSVLATLLFFTGWPYYDRDPPKGSPLTTTVRVFVATAHNISQPIPNHKDLYYEDDTRPTSSLRFLLTPATRNWISNLTRACLDKAAIKVPEGQQPNKWKVCNVHEVEDTKIGIRMLPMWSTFIVVGIVLSIGNTYYLEQANHMDRKLGKIEVSIPIFLLFYKATSSISATSYSFLINCTKKYAPPVGIATGMVLSVLCCITAAKVETRRLHRIRDHGLLDKPEDQIPMSIFALLPQFMLLAAVDGIANNSIKGFFWNQTPESMRRYLTYFTNGVLGLGSMASVLSVYVVGKISEKNGKPNWFQYTLNKSRLDRYYWVLAALSAVNLIIYVIVAYFYEYKESPDGGADKDIPEGGDMKDDFHDKNCCC
ncbi:putative proton-dependent oligopeptide transporter family, MFS transporter superfamily [Helianthus annuus]|nr:putative proton-dependent oligopeptide transporter family, MFS transporter superfamily [Helianthus annuus]KAJ0644356.1 putative proton-dependent oligopeptide transporter family, MFS transporter superfamily [Helianthus annuus]